MDRGSLGADRDGHEVPVPGGELVERGEELLLARAPPDSSRALVGLARRQAERLELAAHGVERRVPHLVDADEQPRRGGGRIEGGVEVDGARDLDEGLTARGSRRVEQPLRAVEPTGGHPRERGDLVLRQARRAVLSTARTAGSDRRRNGTSWHRDLIVSGSGPSSLATSTMTAYGGGSSRSLSSASAASSFMACASSNDVDPPVRLERAHVQVAPQLAHGVDPDHLSERLQDVQVGMRAPCDPLRVSEQRAGEREREPALADAARPVEEVRMRGPVAERRAQQPLRLVLLGQLREGVGHDRAIVGRPASACATSSASASRGAVASRTTIRSGKRAASSR